MTHLERQVRATQHRLWLNQWMRYGCWLAGAGGALFAAVVLTVRLFNLVWPLVWIGGGVLLAMLITSLIWTVVRRVDAAQAATQLDEAAGLRERISSGQYCLGSKDPYAAAVVSDAEDVSASLSARQHIRFSLPPSMGWTSLSLVVAALMFLVPVGLLQSAEQEQDDKRVIEAQQIRTVLKRRVAPLKNLPERSKALEEFKEEFEALDKFAGGPMGRPENMRHDQIKRIDNLADAIKKKRDRSENEAPNEMRKMLRGLKIPKQADAPTAKLSRALRRGDFRTAKEEIKAMKEMLATLKSEPDKKMAQQLSKQLDDLAKQLEQLSEQQKQKLAKKLEKAGLTPEEAKRLLENLKKQDIDQLKKQLEKKGMSKQQAQQLAKQLKKQQAGTACKNMSMAMKQGAKCNNPGQMGEAMSGLSQAADQLSGLEQMEQEMNELDSTLQALNDAKKDMDRPCSNCNGTGKKNGKGCSKCNGSGRGSGSGKGNGKGGTGGKGKGRGGLAEEQETNVGFKTERAKVHTGKGAIIGQILIDGEQIKGEVSQSVREIFTAAEHDALDRIDRDRIPRQYQQAVKAYFSSIRQAAARDAEKKEGDADGASSASDSDSAKEDSKKPADTDK